MITLSSMLMMTKHALMGQKSLVNSRRERASERETHKGRGGRERERERVQEKVAA